VNDYTAEINRNRGTQGFKENYAAAKTGGAVAGNTRRELERKSGKPVISSRNYLSLQNKKARKNSLQIEITDKA
jgi:hypothetical protein